MATLKKLNRDFPLAPTQMPTQEKPTKDSSSYFRKKIKEGMDNFANAFSTRDLTLASNKMAKADKDLQRQKLKGKPGYDKNGFQIKKP